MAHWQRHIVNGNFTWAMATAHERCRYMPAFSRQTLQSPLATELRRRENAANLLSREGKFCDAKRKLKSCSLSNPEFTASLTHITYIISFYSNKFISGGLTTSQFPVFTLYIQKVCLPESVRCNRAWTFESVEGFSMEKFARKRGQVTSRNNCMALCRNNNEFPCRLE